MRLVRFWLVNDGAPVLVALEHVLDVEGPAWSWFNAFVGRDRS